MFKVLLASDYDPKLLRFPLIAFPKLDGIRAYVKGGLVYSRSNKLIPNRQVQLKFSHLDGHDGELIVGHPTDPAVYRETMKIVMAKDRDVSSVKFWVFDNINELNAPYYNRALWLREDKDVHIVPHKTINNMVDLVAYEEEIIEQGYEGLILRDPHAAYKQGRSSAREGILLKMKRFKDAEATVIGFCEKMHNANEATISETGHTRRSGHKANLVPLGTLGAITVIYDGMTFNIGTGFTAAECQEIWNNKEHFMGKLAKFKFLDIGIKDLPRHPVFLGWRDEKDL